MFIIVSRKLNCIFPNNVWQVWKKKTYQNVSRSSSKRRNEMLQGTFLPDTFSVNLQHHIFLKRSRRICCTLPVCPRACVISALVVSWQLSRETETILMEIQMAGKRHRTVRCGREANSPWHEHSVIMCFNLRNCSYLKSLPFNLIKTGFGPGKLSDSMLTSLALSDFDSASRDQDLRGNL